VRWRYEACCLKRRFLWRGLLSDQRDTATPAPTNIALATGQIIDLSFIPETQRNALMAEYMRGTLDVARKANDLHVDVVTCGIPSGRWSTRFVKSPRTAIRSRLQTRRVRRLGELRSSWGTRQKPRKESSPNPRPVPKRTGHPITSSLSSPRSY
jgi:hypothetical protein